jgi:broad specificity phosphatase PhoE
MRLVLCRHAPAGDSEAIALLAAELAELDVGAVYTSPLARAAETARAVAEPHGLTAVACDALREIDFGDVDGRQFEDYPPELQAALLNAPGTVRFPGGESYEQLRSRVVAALEQIVLQHDHETVVAVSHAGAIRAALATWLAVPGEAAFRIDQSLGSVNVVDWLDGGPFVRLVNGRIGSGAPRRL